MSKFSKGQVVRAKIAAQGLKEGVDYLIAEVAHNYTMFGDFVKYRLVDCVGGKTNIWIYNGHVILNETD